jgi:hypothetical protein
MSTCPCEVPNQLTTPSGVDLGESKSKPTANWRLDAIIEKVARVALMGLALYLAPVSTAVCFISGISVGVGYALWNKQAGVDDAVGQPACARSYMEFLSGTKFPPTVNLVSTAVFIAAHARHDPTFYGPFIGLFVGNWCGIQVVNLLSS